MLIIQPTRAHRQNLKTECDRFYNILWWCTQLAGNHINYTTHNMSDHRASPTHINKFIFTFNHLVITHILSPGGLCTRYELPRVPLNAK